MRALLAALAVVMALAAPAAGGNADTSYSDPAGDSNTPGGVDITTVQVADTQQAITLRVTLAAPDVIPDSVDTLFGFLVAFDLDKNPATGDDGDEARLIWDPEGTLSFRRWDGAELVDRPTTGMRASFSDMTFTLTLPRSALGSVPSFGFLVFALLLPNGGADWAPDRDQPYWVYDVVTAPVTLTASNPTGSPRRPVAGRPFTVSMVVLRSDTGAAVTSGSVACSVRIGTARVRAVGTFGAGRARCTLVVPRTAKGKTLKGTITARAAEASVTKPFSFRAV